MLCVCVSACLRVSVSACLCVCVSVYLSVRVSVCLLFELPTNNRLGWKWKTVANTPAYYGKDTFTTLKKIYRTGPRWMYLTSVVFSLIREYFLFPGKSCIIFKSQLFLFLIERAFSYTMTFLVHVFTNILRTSYRVI
jgi:hypothetical protein